MIAEHRADFDRERRRPDAVVRALAGAGMLRLNLSKALGGSDIWPLDFMTIVEAAAALDGSVGWLVGCRDDPDQLRAGWPRKTRPAARHDAVLSRAAGGASLSRRAVRGRPAPGRSAASSLSSWLDRGHPPPSGPPCP
ncbi:hypothetical protein CO675_23265 [Bradyrhizobium sp. C9]|nr:hypothetical protein CO675_23265 [Bradyrhizobium sp. C9]